MSLFGDIEDFVSDAANPFAGDNFLSNIVGGATIGTLLNRSMGGAVGGLAGFTASTINRQRRKAVQREEAAIKQSRLEATENRNRLVEEGFRRRSRSQGMGQGASGLSPGQQGASTQGTSLLSAQDQMPSLFNG